MALIGYVVILHEKLLRDAAASLTPSHGSEHIRLC